MTGNTAMTIFLLVVAVIPLGTFLVWILVNMIGCGLGYTFISCGG